MIKISVIVPIYKGKKYIKKIVHQVERNSDYFHRGEIELLFINDYPDDTIEPVNSDKIIIRVYNTDKNRGIQGARVVGCKMSSGKYILFLDQDDVIYDDCLRSQYRNIISYNAEVSVCRANESGRQVYNATNPFENVGNYEYMLNDVNPIVSPGQVLIKKDVVSEIWQNNILDHNGADDWLLWLCMLAENRKFVLNDRVLYEHIVDGNNTSFNVCEMLMSEYDVFKVIEKQSVFSKREIMAFKNTIQQEQFRHIQILEKYRDFFFLYNKWMSLENIDGSIADYILRLGYKTIAIYGYGYIGKQLVSKIRGSKVNVVGVIDKNANYIDAEIPVNTMENFNCTVDAIIVTAIMSDSQLSVLKSNTTNEIITIQQLLDKWDKAI